MRRHYHEVRYHNQVTTHVRNEPHENKEVYQSTDTDRFNYYVKRH